MNTRFFKTTLQIFAFLVFISAAISCSNNNKTETNNSSAAVPEKVVIPDSIVQFLITSAAADFRSHQPPTAIDIRNVRIGYMASTESKKIFVLCGEFLSKEDNTWVEFTTIKTSGYEQYLGKTQYCQDAIFVLPDENLSAELKKKLSE